MILQYKILAFGSLTQLNDSIEKLMKSSPLASPRWQPHGRYRYLAAPGLWSQAMVLIDAERSADA